MKIDQTTREKGLWGAAVTLQRPFHWAPPQDTGVTMAGTVTELRFQKQARDRVNVYLDGRYAFALPATEAARLRKGQFLSDAEIQALQQVDLRAKALDRALRFLAVRPRSTWEVRQHLSRYRPQGRPLPQEHVAWVLARLEEQGYLDDRAFAQYWVEQRRRFSPRGVRALAHELRQKGVPASVIEPVLASVGDEVAAAQEALRKRLHGWRHLDEETFRRKAQGYLQRRGFDWETIAEVLAHLGRGDTDPMDAP